MDGQLVVGLMLVIVTLVTAEQASNPSKCKQSSFIVSQGRRSFGRVIDSSFVDSLVQCINRCTLHADCVAVNFLSASSTRLPECQLLEYGDIRTTKESDDAMYYAQGICFEGGSVLCNRAWSFEQFQEISVTDGNLIIRTLTLQSLSDCLAACLSVAEEQCRAVNYRRRTQECRLLRVGPHSVRLVEHFFRDDNNNGDDAWDLYENNCRREKSLSRRCNFLQIKSAGLTDMFDEKMANIFDAKTCQQQCLEWKHGLCRHYTFDKSTATCYLTHTTTKVLGLSTLTLRESHLEMGDLDDCIDFRLQCRQNSMLIRGESMKLFSGLLHSKNLQAQPDLQKKCDTRIANAFEFEADLPYNGCGTIKEHKVSGSAPTYTNLIFLKDGSTELITVRDKLVQVICRIYTGEDVEVTYHLRITGNSTNQLIQDPVVVAPVAPLAIRPRYQLDVLAADLQPAKEVSDGDTGYLVFASDKDASFSDLDFEITDVWAADLNGRTVLELYDADGCPVDLEMAKPFRADAQGRLTGRIKFTGFTDGTRVIYKALVKPCIGSCEPVCDEQSSKRSSHRRKKRFAHVSTPRRYVLSEEKYQVTGAVVLRRSGRPAPTHIEIDKATGKGAIVPVQSSSAIETNTTELKKKPTSSDPEDPLAQGRASSRPSRKIRLPQLLNLLDENDRADSLDNLEYNDYEQIGRSRVATSGRIEQCLTENLACLMTVLLALLQAVLFCSCLVVAYFYVGQLKDCLMLRRLRNQARHSRDTLQYVVEPAQTPQIPKKEALQGP